ncbi:STAS domain-containing protein [Solirhodobacter olei]|uniref:STAS domain-containing protein n=1 Tax=Solirhodobacter olei TaxID=2493082 RepID=UPI000FD996CE|nr:STAS domain-containing protein [Solirhodobacter olei]
MKDPTPDTGGKPTSAPQSTATGAAATPEGRRGAAPTSGTNPAKTKSPPGTAPSTANQPGGRPQDAQAEVPEDLAAAEAGQTEVIPPPLEDEISGDGGEAFPPGTADETMETIALPEVADQPRAADLYERLAACVEHPVRIDAAAVQFIGTPVFQILLAARAAWQEADLPFEVHRPSDGYLACGRRLGIDPTLLEGASS